MPDPEKSLEQGAVLPWRRGGKRMVVYYKGLLRGVAKHYQQSMETPYKTLPEDFQRVLLWGSGETEIEFTFWRAGKIEQSHPPLRGRRPQSPAPLSGERKRIHPQPPQGLHEPAVLRCLPGPHDSSRRYSP